MRRTNKQFKPNQSASGRTKNRFREHQLVLSGNDEGGRKADNVFGLLGIPCLLFESIGRDKLHVNTPRWMGWIPISEIEVHKKD